MSVTFINYSYIGGSSGTSRAAPKPTNTAQYDIMFAMISTDNRAINTVPTGWELIATAYPEANTRFFLYYKIAGASEPAEYTWDIVSGKTMIITVTYRLSFRPKPIIMVSNTDYTTNNSTVRAASFNIRTNHCILFYFGSIYNTIARTFTKPAGIGSDVWTEDVDYGDLTPDFWTTIGSMVFTSSGATGNIDVTCSSNISGRKHCFAIAVERDSGRLLNTMM
jgi:hypothetical protein